MMDKNTQLTWAAIELLIGIGCGYFFVQNLSRENWWQLLALFGLCGFTIQLGATRAWNTIKDQPIARTSVIEIRMGQFFVALGAIGFVGYLVTR